MENITRIPRPIGTTQLGLQLQGQDIREHEIKKHVLKDYIRTGFKYLGQPMGIPKLSQYIGIGEQEINEVLYEMAPQMVGLADTDDITGTVRALYSQVFLMAQEDRHQAQTQLGLLAHSQEGKYKPFISAEVTKALKVNQEATKNILQALQALMGGGPSGGTTVNVFNTQPDESHNGPKAITTDEAVAMMNVKEPKGLKVGDTPEAHQYLEELDFDIPEISARKMESEKAVPKVGGLINMEYKTKPERQAERDAHKEGSIE